MAAPDAALSAELLLIGDFPIDDDQRRLIRLLFADRTTDADLVISSPHGRGIGRWPLRFDFDGPTTLSGLVHQGAIFLTQRHRVVTELRNTGCNLELSLRVPGLGGGFSLSSSTMKLLADLHIQLSFLPTTGD